MFTLKCEFCGYEQTIKKKIDKYTYYELTHCKHLWCPCNKCKEQNPRPRIIDKGLVNMGGFSENGIVYSLKKMQLMFRLIKIMVFGVK